MYQMIDKEVKMSSLTNKTVLITGSTDGLGREVAFEMAAKGAVVLLHGRNWKKGEHVLKQIRAESNNEKHRYYNADFSSLHEVYSMAQLILSQTLELNILINNAGIGGGHTDDRQISEDGYELRFTVNYLAPFVLTNYLLPLLMKSAPAKIVNVVSGAQEPIDFSDVMLMRNYSGRYAYAQSKLALIMYTFDLAENLKDKGITVNCLHPASMMDTKLVRESGGKPRASVKEGTDTVMYVTASPETENITGAYFDHHQQATAHPQAYDSHAREKLHEITLKMTEIPIIHSTRAASEMR